MARKRTGSSNARVLLVLVLRRYVCPTACRHKRQGQKRVRVDFDTSAGDETYTKLKASLEMAKQLTKLLAEALICGGEGVERGEEGTGGRGWEDGVHTLAVFLSVMPPANAMTTSWLLVCCGLFSFLIRVFQFTVHHCRAARPGAAPPLARTTLKDHKDVLGTGTHQTAGPYCCHVLPHEALFLISSCSATLHETHCCFALGYFPLCGKQIINTHTNRGSPFPKLVRD